MGTCVYIMLCVCECAHVCIVMLFAYVVCVRVCISVLLCVFVCVVNACVIVTHGHISSLSPSVLPHESSMCECVCYRGAHAANQFNFPCFGCDTSEPTTDQVLFITSISPSQYKL